MPYLCSNFVEMIKKRTAIFVILLANILLSAHAFIPHHHHDDEICITTVHNHDDCEEQNHDSTEHKHEHEGERTSDCCILNPVVVFTSNQVKHVSKCFGCLDIHHSTDFSGVLFNSDKNTVIPTFVTSDQIPDIPSSYTQFVGSSIGLRAPPIV